MDRLWQDLRYAVRSLRRDLGFTATIIITLAIGIGVNTAVFSVVRSVLLVPLPFPDSEELVVIWTEIADQGVQQATSGFANVQDWRAQNRVFRDLATFDPITLTVTDGEWPEQVTAAKSSANLFSVLEVEPAVGRTFSPDEETARAPVVVLSHAFAQRTFSGPAAAVGRTIAIGGTTFEVAGVMSEWFGFPDRSTQFWIPESWFTNTDAAATERGSGPWNVIGRLNDGVSLRQAREEMNLIAARLEREYPAANAGIGVTATSLRDQVTGSSFRLSLWTLYGAVGLVLLIACANGAHLILARGVGRSREFTLRLALGASTPRLTRQTLTESLVLAVGAGAAGVALAVVGLRLLIALAPGSIPRLDELGIDGPVLMYATIVSLLVGVIFGLTPALGLGRGTLAAALREGIGPAGGQRGQRLRGVLIVFQFALAMILVFGASLLIRSLMEANRVDAGFRSDDVIMANLSVPEPERRSVFYEQLVQEVPTIPGVRSAAIVEDLFLSGAPNRAITVEGGESAEPGLVSLRVDAIAGDFFGTIGVALRQGRDFLPSDGAETVPVAIVNETMAQRFWPGESPIGKRFRIGPAGPDNDWLEVVGLVGDMRRQGPETPPIAQLFRPYSQAPSRNMVLLVRTLSPDADLTAAIRTRVAAIDGTVPLYGTTTVNEALDRFLVQRRFQSSLLGLFSGIALILAAVGIYGLIQYSVLQRTREIGVRMALGGTPQQVTALILRQGLSVALPGLALGMACALMLAEAVSALLFGVAAADLTNILITAGILLATTVVACYLPARRAAAILPMTALRR